MTVKLHHQRSGEGPALLVLHGLFGSSSNWRTMARTLAQRYSVYLIDLRNHGRSGHDPDMAYPAMAEDVFTLADELGLRTFHLLGHSMGGKTAMRMALSRPARVSSLVVADIAPVDSTSDNLPVLEALTQLDLSALTTRGDADKALSATLPEAPLRAFLLQNLTTSPAGLGWRIPLGTIEAAMPVLQSFDCTPDTESYPGPALFVRGGNSDYLLPAHLPIIESLFPNASLQTIPEAGHWLHAEKPVEFAQLCREFLAAVDPNS